MNRLSGTSPSSGKQDSSRVDQRGVILLSQGCQLEHPHRIKDEMFQVEDHAHEGVQCQWMTAEGYISNE